MLGLWSAVSIVIGTVIGSGIFLVSGRMIGEVGSTRHLFFVWIVGGLLSLFGALTYAELAAAMPEAGGEYVLSAGSLRAVLGLFVQLDAIGGRQKRFYRHAGHRAFILYLAFSSRVATGRAIHYRIGPGGGPLEIHYRPARRHRPDPRYFAVNYVGVEAGGHFQVFVTA